MPSSRFTIIRRILGISFKKPLLMSLSVLLATISSLMYFVPYLVIYKILKVLFLHSESLSGTSLISLSVIAVCSAILNVGLYFGALILSHVAAFETSFDLKILLAEKLAKLPVGFHLEYGSGRQYQLMDSGISNIQSFIAHKLPDMVISVVYPVTMILIIIAVDLRFGLAMLFGIAIAYVFHYLSMGRGGAKHMMDLYYDALEQMESASLECIRGISVIKAYGKKSSAFQKLDKSISDYTNMVIPYTRNWEKHMPWFFTLVGNIYLFLIPVAILTAPSSFDAWPDFAVRFLFNLILAPSLASIIPKIGRIMEEFMRVNADVENYHTLMAAKELPQPEGNTTADNSTLSFEHVSFSYKENADYPALSDISFTVSPGTTTAIVGASGSGKSTIASLIARFWDVENGRITIGNMDIRDMKINVLMDQIAFVLQNDRIFSQSIYDNIRCGKECTNPEDVINAARAANCHDFIEKLPDGYNTIIGSEGTYLSTGQIQRIVLARAFLKNAPIIVMDEATASQDEESETLIKEAITRLVDGKTVVIIAHRLNTISNADQILVMENGKIVERGNHNTLLEKNGVYSKLWNTYRKTLDWHIK
nr:ABC transporter ATP-binding protein [uncultured Butyrivibrio sp.]